MQISHSAFCILKSAFIRFLPVWGKCGSVGGMAKQYLIALLACATAWGMESFEKLPAGEITAGELEFGAFAASPGHAEIMNRGRTGKQSLRIKGGEACQGRFKLASALKKDTRFSFWMERWTKKEPFQVRLVAVTGSGEKEVDNVKSLGSGGFKHQIKSTLPAGTKELLVVATTPADTGILIDDFSLMTGKMKLAGAEVHNPGVWPIMKRARFNPAVKIKVQTEGAEDALSLDQLKLSVSDPDQVARVTLRSGSANGMDFKESVVYGSAEPNKSGKVVIKSTQPLEGGENNLWLDVEPGADAVIGSSVEFSDVKLTIGGKELEPAMEPVRQRIGIMLAFPGDKVRQLNGPARDCAAFRIPGLVQTKKGTLIGCFDARYDNEVDLCRDIDVAAVRSTDGGQTWTMPAVNMDSGPGMANGCGDPCILQDKKGRIWMQALACHFAPGARAINASGTGTDAARTGQWEMVYSDDDGKSWSQIKNVTSQVKKDEWNLILAGPGNGICTSKGVIVFPAQIWQHNAKPNCRSTICYSKDGGKTWKMGEGVPEKTSECQVVELADGSLMLNCRNEAYTGKRVVYITKDLGESWEAHETNRTTLNDPTCQASLVAVETKKYGRLLLFSNPWIHGRSNMSIRASQDEGVTWSQGVLYDARNCMGYSCVALTDPDHVGIIYETCHNNGETNYRGIGFIRLPLESIVTGKEMDAKPASADTGKKGKKGKKGRKKRKRKG